MVGEHGLDSSGTGQGEVVESCKYDNEPLDSMKPWYFLMRIANCQGLFPWNSLTLQNLAAYFLFNTLHYVIASTADTNTITSQTFHPSPSVKSSYHPPFLLQLPWIVPSQDSCQYREQMTGWLTKLKFLAGAEICLIINAFSPVGGSTQPDLLSPSRYHTLVPLD